MPIPTLLAASMLLVTLAATLAACAPSPPVPSGRPADFRLVQYPQAGFGEVYRQTASAAHSIELEIYELSDPVEEHALIEASRRGVAVRVLLDAAFVGRKANAAAYALLHSSGVAVRWAPANTIFHIKTIVFDRAVAVISTANLTPQYYDSSRDAAVIDRDPAQVAAIAATFDQDWSGTPIGHAEHVAGGLVWSPNAEPVVVALIGRARTSVDFTSEELADPLVTTALADAARRGARCRIVMTDSDDWHTAFRTVTAAGCAVHVLAPSAGLYIHEKLLLIDGGSPRELLLLGSQNASYTSLSANRELGIELDRATAPGILTACATTFEADFARASSWRA